MKRGRGGTFERSFFESSLAKEKVIQLTKTFEISTTTGASGTTNASATLSLTLSDGYAYFYYDKRADDLSATLRFLQQGSITLSIKGEVAKSETFYGDPIPLPLEEVGIPANGLSLWRWPGKCPKLLRRCGRQRSNAVSPSSQRFLRVVDDVRSRGGAEQEPAEIELCFDRSFHHCAPFLAS